MDDNNKLNVLVDCTGHSDLYYSLYSLFEKRLGMNLYRPLGGEDWSKKGVHTASVHSEEGKTELIDDVYHISMEMDYAQNAITFNKFIDMDFDIIVATTYINEEPFYNIIKSNQLNVKFIRQIGNIHETPVHCKNVLIGLLTPMSESINYIKYHPEHYKDYSYTDPNNHNTIKNFAGNMPFYPIDLNLWDTLKTSLPDFIFKMHGQAGYDGSVPHLLLSESIKESAFVWHIKPHGGGGFTARQALACGRPCIVKKSYCKIHYAIEDELFKDGINCIDFDLRTFEENVKMIREWSEPEAHIERCKIVAETFKEDVNFEEEACRIRTWIENIVEERL